MEVRESASIVCRCPVCDREVLLARPEAGASCPHCTAPLGVTAEVAARLVELQRTHAAAAALHQDAEGERRHRSRVYGVIGALVTLGFAAVVITASILPVYLHLHGLLSEDTLGWLVPATSLGSFVVVGVPVLMWVNRRPRGGPLAPAVIDLAGPPDLAAVERVARATADEERRARLARASQDRITYARAAGRSAVGCLDLAIGGGIAVPMALAAGSVTIPVLRGHGDPGDGQIALLLWGVVAACVLVVALLRWRRTVLVRRNRNAVAEVRSWLGGVGDLSNVDRVAWLNEYWAAPTPDDDLFAGPYHVSASGTVLGYPVMLEFEPYGLSDETMTIPARALIHVAITDPGFTDGAGPTDDTARLIASIERAGFTVRIEPGAGLLARADAATVERLRNDPSRLSDLRPVIADLATLAATIAR